MNTVSKQDAPSYLVQIWNAEYGDVEEKVVARTFQEGVQHILDSIGRFEGYVVEALMCDGRPSLTVMKGDLTLASVEVAELSTVASDEVAAAVGRLMEGNDAGMTKLFGGRAQSAQGADASGEQASADQTLVEIDADSKTNGSALSSVLVSHWRSERYTGDKEFGSPEGDYAVEVNDRRRESGQLWVTSSPESGNTDDLLSICMEVSNLQESEGSTQVAHIHIGSDDVLFSIFKRAGSLALRLGQDVKLSQEALDDDGPTVWII